MSDPIRPVDPIVAAAITFGAEFPDPARVAPSVTPLDPETIAVAAAALAAAAPSAPATDLLLLGTPPAPLNPVLPELLAARARLLLRPDDEEEEARPPERETPERDPREPALPPDQEDDEPAP